MQNYQYAKVKGGWSQHFTRELLCQGWVSCCDKVGIMDNIQAIIEECKAIKRDLGYTNQFIAERTGIPEGTVARVFGSKAYSFKYETIQPIIAFLVKECDVESLPLQNNDVVALCADIVSSKDSEIATMRTEHRTELGSLKAEHKETVQELKQEYQSKIEELKKTISRQKLLIIVMVTTILILAIIDFSYTNIGWWRGFPS